MILLSIFLKILIIHFNMSGWSFLMLISFTLKPQFSVSKDVLSGFITVITITRKIKSQWYLLIIYHDLSSAQIKKVQILLSRGCNSNLDQMSRIRKRAMISSFFRCFKICLSLSYFCDFLHFAVKKKS